MSDTPPPANAATDRRPIKSRDQPIWQRTASLLVKLGVSANMISLGGMIAGILAGIAFACTALLEPGIGQRLLWLAAAACIQLRLIANMLDGMVAIESQTSSPVGALYNEVPDRVSDAATLIGLGYAFGSTPWLGYTAACIAIFVAYVRAQGKVAGAAQCFIGPMAKPQRMAACTVASVFIALTPASWSFHWWGPGQQWGVPQAVLLLIAAGGIITALRRLRRIALELRSNPPA